MEYEIFNPFFDSLSFLTIFFLFNNILNKKNMHISTIIIISFIRLYLIIIIFLNY